MKRAQTIVLAVLVLAIAGAGLAAEKADKKPAKKAPATSLSAVADNITKGKINVGKKYGMGSEQRFHKIHADVVGLDCATCHVDKADPSVAVFTEQPPVDISKDAPGPVDRRVCQGCHRSGPARDVYGAGSR